MARLPADGWIALALIALSGLFLNELFGTEASGAFVTTTTLPIALSFALLGLSTLLLAGAVVRGAPAAPQPAEARGRLGPVAAMVGWIALYVAALPWAGYLLASGVFLVGASLLYGNRRWPVILAWAVLLPGALLLFFERVMIVLLPSSRLLG